MFLYSAHSRDFLFCSFSVSMQRGTSSDNSGGRSVLLTVGCKTTQPSLCGFRIRSLAVWERTLSAKEVRSIYLAGTKGISKCLLRNVKKVIFQLVCHSWHT